MGRKMLKSEDYSLKQIRLIAANINWLNSLWNGAHPLNLNRGLFFWVSKEKQRE